MADNLCRAATINGLDEVLNLLKHPMTPKFINRLNSRGQSALQCAAASG